MATESNVCYLYRYSFPSLKEYIGISNHPLFRVKEHRGYKTPCGSAIRKYGLPVVEILYCGTRKMCLLYEQSLTVLLDTVVPNGYNLQKGGTGGSSPSKLTRKRISEAAKGRKHSQAEKNRRAESLRGLKRSPEQRKRMSEAAKKRGMPRATIEAGARNRKFTQTEEYRQKQSLITKKSWAKRKQQKLESEVRNRD